MLSGPPFSHVYIFYTSYFPGNRHGMTQISSWAVSISKNPSGAGLPDGADAIKTLSTGASAATRMQITLQKVYVCRSELVLAILLWQRPLLYPFHSLLHSPSSPVPESAWAFTIIAKVQCSSLSAVPACALLRCKKKLWFPCLLPLCWPLYLIQHLT